MDSQSSNVSLPAVSNEEAGKHLCDVSYQIDLIAQYLEMCSLDDEKNPNLYGVSCVLKNTATHFSRIDEYICQCSGSEAVTA